jgi:eukaryotic-like serine/threonine-protein kinase
MGDDDLQSPADAGEALSPEAEASDPWIGQALAGYEIQRRIGEGGMGIVYLARHQSLNRSAAVKFLGAHMVTDKAYIERFLHEAQGAAKLNHPNIVQVYDAGSMGEDVFYFIMEYIEGTDLGILLRENKILPVQDSVGYIRQACSALNYAHRNGIIHRDVKPDNLMLTADGTIKLGDLGLAKWTTDEGSGGMTQTGIVMGTPFYISPEQVRGSRDVDSRADIYSLGASLFHMVTSKIPYEGPSPAVIMAMHLNNSVPEPHKVNPALDRDICAIIKKLMAKKPDERYQTMQEVDVVLAEYQSRKSHPSQLLGGCPRIGPGKGGLSDRLHPLAVASG